MMAVFFFIAHEKGSKLHVQPQTGVMYYVYITLAGTRNSVARYNGILWPVWIRGKHGVLKTLLLLWVKLVYTDVCTDENEEVEVLNANNSRGYNPLTLPKIQQYVQEKNNR